MKPKRNPGADNARPTTYADAGVDRHAGSRAVEMIRNQVRSTFRPEVVGDIGGFGGAFAFDSERYRDPLLVSSTDGAGTKVMIAQMMGDHSTIGIDLVAMSVNDVAAHGAEPLFFLDYILIDKVVEEVIRDIVAGISEGCRQAGCALIGGEMAEHRGHLADPGSYDLAGFCVGVVDRSRLVTGDDIARGDVIIGIASSGLHSNGFSLVRKVLLDQMGLRLDHQPMEIETTLGEELLRPTLIYSPVMQELMALHPRGFAHITQGGFEENLGRILPGGVQATIERGSWEIPPIFGLISSLGRVEDAEMYATFNMGIGMVVVVAAESAHRALDIVRSRGHHAYEIGVMGESKAGPNVVLR